MLEHLLQRAKLYQFQLLFSGGKKTLLVFGIALIFDITFACVNVGFDGDHDIDNIWGRQTSSYVITGHFVFGCEFRLKQLQLRILLKLLRRLPSVLICQLEKSVTSNRFCGQTQPEEVARKNIGCIEIGMTEV